MKFAAVVDFFSEMKEQEQGVSSKFYSTHNREMGRYRIKKNTTAWLVISKEHTNKINIKASSKDRAEVTELKDLQ